MKLSVPTNWDSELLEKLADYPVHDIYGVSDKNIIGAGRPAWALPSVSRKEIERHIKKIHSLGKTFTYLLNAPCLNNMEYNRKTRWKIIEYIKWINDIGVDYVSVTIPYLMEIIKNNFPKLKLKASTILHINSVQKAKFFEMLGIDDVTVDFMINRDFRLLESIKRSTKSEITLILNDVCLYQCPFRYYHYNIVGHSSQILNPFRGFYPDYCTIKCIPIRLTSFKEILKIRWIRPEDINEYEKIGIDSFKISGRTHSTDWILRAVKAYLSREYDGNLLDLIDCLESSNGGLERRPFNIRKNRNFINYALTMPFRLCKNYYNWYLIKDEMSKYIYIDNRKLDGFIDFFKKNDCLSSCTSCDYCGRWANEVISADQIQIDKYVNNILAISKKLISIK